jgi:hypothetical protein
MRRALAIALLLGAGTFLMAAGVVLDGWHYVSASNGYITVAGFASQCRLSGDRVGLDPRPAIVDCSRTEMLTSVAAGLIALGVVAFVITAVIGFRGWQAARSIAVSR